MGWQVRIFYFMAFIADGMTEHLVATQGLRHPPSAFLFYEIGEIDLWL